jgi:hypothetical protein
MAATSSEESKLLSILLRQTNDALHLLVIHAQLLAEVLDHCRNTTIHDIYQVGSSD